MIITTDHTATVETIEWLRQMIEPLYAALDKPPLKVWRSAHQYAGGLPGHILEELDAVTQWGRAQFPGTATAARISKN